MFWALEQRQKRQKAFRDEIAAQTERAVFARLESVADENGDGVVPLSDVRKAFREARSNSNGKEQGKDK